MTDSYAILRAVLTEILSEDPGPITAATRLTEDLDLDSIRFVQFLLALEERVPGLEFNQETLSDLSFDDAGSLVAHIDGVAAAQAA